MENTQYLIHLDDRIKSAELDMKSNLIQLDNIYRLLQTTALQDQLSNNTSADDCSPHDASLKDPHYLHDSGKTSKLKADMEYISKELNQTRRDINEARTQVRLFVKLRVFRPS